MSGKAERRLAGTVMGSALTAANEIHIALCHAPSALAKRALIRALHNVMIVAEEARQSINDTLDAAEVSEEDHD